MILRPMYAVNNILYNMKTAAEADLKELVGLTSVAVFGGMMGRGQSSGRTGADYMALRSEPATWGVSSSPRSSSISSSTDTFFILLAAREISL